MRNVPGFTEKLIGSGGAVYVPSFKATPARGFDLPMRFVKEIYTEPLGEREAWTFIHWFKPSRKGPHHWMGHGRGNMGGDEPIADSWVKCVRWEHGERNWISGWHVFISEQDAKDKLRCYISDPRWKVTKVLVRGIRYLIQQPVMNHPVLICEEILVPFPVDGFQ